jgi:hypothetical protein
MANFFLMIFDNVEAQFRIRIHYLYLRIWILQKVSDSCGSRSTRQMMKFRSIITNGDITYCSVGETYVKQANEASSVRLNKLARLLDQRKLPDKVPAPYLRNNKVFVTL